MPTNSTFNTTHKFKALMLTALAICLLVGLSYVTTRNQVKPNLTIANNNHKHLIITTDDRSSVNPTTKKITTIIIDNQAYHPTNNWLITKPNTNLNNEIEFYNSEALLYSAITKPSIVITEDGTQYSLTFSPLQWQDYGLVFYSTRILSTIVLFFSIWIYYIAPNQRGSFVALIGSFSLTIAFLIADKWLYRAWAMDPIVLYTTIKIAELFGIFYSTSIFYLIWHLPKPLFKQRFSNFIPVFILIFLLTIYLLDVSGLTNNPPNSLDSYFTIVHLLVFTILAYKVFNHYKTRQNDILGWMAIRWVAFATMIAIIIPSSFHLLATTDMLDTVPAYVNDSIIFIKLGLSALVASTVLYQAETIWWRLWVILISFTVFILSYLTLHIFNLFPVLQLYIVLASTLLTAYYTFYYVKKRYVINVSIAMQTVLPKLLEINQTLELENIKTKTINLPSSGHTPWIKALIQLFKPLKVEYLSNSGFIDLSQDKSLINIDKQGECITTDPLVAHMYSAGAMVDVKDLNTDVYVRFIGVNYGMRLFTDKDVKLITTLWNILKHHQKTQLSFVKGETHERRRIAADLHDDIGGKLLYLANREGELGAYAHETLQDLRILARGLSNDSKSFSELFADINFQLGEQCDDNGIPYESTFDIQKFSNVTLSPRFATSLVSVLNKLVRHAFKYKEVIGIQLIVKYHNNYLIIRFLNEGTYINVSSWHDDSNLSNINKRIKSCGGTLQWITKDYGSLECKICFPMEVITSKHYKYFNQ